MTHNEQIFCDEYLIDLNQTRAYKAAYRNVTKDSVAAAAASRLMNKPKIKEYINKRMAEKEDKLIAKQDEVLEYLTSVMRREKKEVVVVTLRKETSAYKPDESGTMRKCTVKEEVPQLVEIPAKLSDSNKAAELLGKRYGLYTEKLKVDNPSEDEKVHKLDNIASILSQMKPLKEGD